MLELVALALGLAHFTIPLAYYAYLKGRVKRSWNIEVDEGYMPTLTVIVPTYNEAALIESRLENIGSQSYPKEKMEVIVVDSGSTDGTAELVRKWALGNPYVKVRVVKEAVRRGKAHALNTGLRHVTGDIVVLADADSLWAKNALKEVAKYFSDLSVGAVTAVKEPEAVNPHGRMTIESTYRSFYNVVRVAESKIHSTPIFHGELAAFRRNLLEEIGGFPTSIGADDSHMAALLALKGFRAIAVPEAIAYELTPSSWRDYVKWKKRRALHLVQHFSKLLRKLRQAPKGFGRTLVTESFLHLLNPWLLLTAFIAFLASIVTDGLSPLKLAIIIVAPMVLVIRPAREALFTWIIDQLILVYSAIAGIRSKELIWEKIEELR